MESLAVLLVVRPVGTLQVVIRVVDTIPTVGVKEEVTPQDHTHHRGGDSPIQEELVVMQRALLTTPKVVNMEVLVLVEVLT